MPFDGQQFIDVFAAYNTTVFPAQVILLVAGLLAIRLASNGDTTSSRVTAAILSLFWLWMGYVYHWVFFLRINDLAVGFGAMFAAQAAIIFYAGVIRTDLFFERSSGTRTFIGTCVLVYSLILYPLIGMRLGHSYPYSPTFGLPCPTTIFTFGLLARSAKRLPVYVLPLMLSWVVIGSSAAYLFGMFEDLGLIVAAGATIAVLVSERLDLRAEHLSLRLRRAVEGLHRH